MVEKKGALCLSFLNKDERLDQFPLVRYSFSINRPCRDFALL